MSNLTSWPLNILKPLIKLQNLRAPLAKLLPLTKPFHTDPSRLDHAIDDLRQAKPEEDFLATPPTAPSNNPSVNRKVDSVLAQLTPAISNMGEAEKTASAPIITLISSNNRLRDFGYNDASIREDIDDSSATTMALALGDC